jgi:UDP-N-acetylglucosamine--N-acetylmuramyl-(pentapeptide) pyrophosphoryl-undecaprenol N-acetylglucosamine transferase
MRLLICAGGTGGGVYPALAVLRALLEGDLADGKDPEISSHSVREQPELEVLWIGGIGGMEEELVRRENIPFQAIPAAGVHGVGLRTLPGNILQVKRGFSAARKVINKFCPDVMFFTGGYVAVSVALAGRFYRQEGNRPKIVLYVPDIEPGLALKVLSRLADRIMLTVEESMTYFANQSKLMVSGYPTRADLRIWSLDEARKVFDLSPNYPTLLVFGGSKGAHSINQAFMQVLPDVLAETQVIHISGHLDWPIVENSMNSLDNELRTRYHAYPYLHSEMGAALRAADLVVSRAGASVLGEYPIFGLPAILVPYPHAWRYQDVNARYLEDRGAATIIKDEDLATNLLPTIRALISDRSRRDSMSRAILGLAKPDAARSIAKLLYDLAEA